MARDFSKRSEEKELMDEEGFTFSEFHDCLRQLEIINYLTLAYPPTIAWVTRILAGRPREQGLRVLDVACGGGDMSRRLWERLGGRYPGLTFRGIDLNPLAKQSAEKSTPPALPITFATKNLFDLEPEPREDVIISSLFTHHLRDEEVIAFIKWMEKRAEVGWFVNDLHRHWLPYYFIKAATRLFSRNRLIRNDASVSVARAFTYADWRRILDAADIPRNGVRILWRFPFRICIAREKSSAVR